MHRKKTPFYCQIPNATETMLTIIMRKNRSDEAIGIKPKWQWIGKGSIRLALVFEILAVLGEKVKIIIFNFLGDSCTYSILTCGTISELLALESALRFLRKGSIWWMKTLFVFIGRIAWCLVVWDVLISIHLIHYR